MKVMTHDSLVITTHVQRYDMFDVQLVIQPRPRRAETGRRIEKEVLDGIDPAVFYDSETQSGSIEVDGKAYHYSINADLCEEDEEYD